MTSETHCLSSCLHSSCILYKVQSGARLCAHAGTMSEASRNYPSHQYNGGIPALCDCQASAQIYLFKFSWQEINFQEFYSGNECGQCVTRKGDTVHRTEQLLVDLCVVLQTFGRGLSRYQNVTICNYCGFVAKSIQNETNKNIIWNFIYCVFCPLEINLII